MSPTQLKALLNELRVYAQQLELTFILEHPSDLLQCEVSYLYTGSDIILLLHVPMIPANTQLRLMRSRPFPLPLGNNTGLLPVLHRNVLAISSDPVTKDE